MGGPAGARGTGAAGRAGLPGFGSRKDDPPDSEASLDDYEADLLAQLDERGIDEAILAGVSFGAQLAMRIAAHHPDRVLGLVLSATQTAAASEQEQGQFSAIADGVAAQGPGALVEQFTGMLLGDETLAERPQVVDAFQSQMASAASADGLAAAFRALARRPDPEPLLPAIEAPTLLIYGVQDKVVPISEAERAERAIPQARLRRLEGAGHLPNLELPEDYNELVNDFLAEIRIPQT